MNEIRFTIVDHDGAVSFMGPCHAIKMLTAACSRSPQTAGQLLEMTQAYDHAFGETIRCGLAVFDEHNTRESNGAFRQMVNRTESKNLPPFRVYDDESRRLSLAPAGSGLILFNLPARRIVQVQNSYAELLRSDRGRIWENGRPTEDLYHYKLPADWQIVP